MDYVRQAADVLPLSSAPVQSVASLVQDLQSSNVHSTYFPFVRFGALHALRVSLGWALASRRRASLADLAAFLVMAWGGSTLASMLLSTPPVWLLSPGPWIVYVSAYVLFVATGVAHLVHRIFPLPLLAPILAFLDGLLRGTTACAMGALAASKGMSTWSGAVLAAIATTAGAHLVQLLGADNGVPRAPAVLAGGIWTTLEVWGAMAVSVAYTALTQPTAQVDGKKIDAGAARAALIIVFAGLFAVRAAIHASKKRAASPPVAVTEKVTKAVTEKAPASKSQTPAPKAKEEKMVEVVQSPTASGGAKKRKNKKKAAAAAH